MGLLAGFRAALDDRYRLGAVVGRGGSATVFRGLDRRYGRAVAVKVLHPELLTTQGADRFLDEIRITAQLQHPHILPLLDSGCAAHHLYLVTPFVRGRTLSERLEAEGSLPVREALRLAIAVGEALTHAHRQGVVHLDVKPANILLSNGHPVIADFGIARAASDILAGERFSGLPAGTPEYMSPEQVAARDDLDGRSDVYSLACVLYEMLAGEAPFSGSSPAVVMSRHLNAEPPSVRAAARGVPDSLERVLVSALAKNPAARFETAERFAEALRDELESLTTPARRTGALSATFGVAVLTGLAWSAVASAAAKNPPPVDDFVGVPAKISTVESPEPAPKHC